MKSDSEKIFLAAIESKPIEAIAQEFQMTESEVIATVSKEFAQRSSMAREISYSDPMALFPEGFPAFNPSLLVTKKGMKIYDEIRRDEQVKSAMGLKKHSVLAPGWEINSPEGQGEEWEVTKFVKEVLDTKIQDGFKNVLLQIMTAMDYGYSISEKIFQPDDGKVILKAIKTRKPHHFEFELDRHGNLVALYQENIYDNHPRKPLPIDKFVIYSYQKEWSNPYGTSDLDAVYTPWWSKYNSVKWLAMLLERFGIPPVFGIYNSGRYTPEQIATLRQMLERLQAGTSGVIPRNNPTDFELWSPELANQAASVFIPALDHYDKQIARALLVPDMLGVSPQGEVGSYAQASVHFDSFILIIQHIQGEIAAIVNEQIVKPLVDLNFNVDQYPKFGFLPLLDEDRVKLMTEWREHVKAGTVTHTIEDETHIRSTLHFPEKDEAEIEAEKKKKQQEKITEQEEMARINRENSPANNGNTNQNPPNQNRNKGNPKVERPGKFSMEQRTELTRFEIARNVQFEYIAAEADYEDSQTINELEQILYGYVSAISRAPTVKDMLPIVDKLKKEKKVRSTLQKRFMQAFDQGRSRLRQELGKAEEFANLDEEGANKHTGNAKEWLKMQAENVASHLDLKVIQVARMAVLKALELGETVDQAADRVRQAVRPLVTRPDRIETYKGKPLTPHVLQTIVRTNANTAFNMGRLIEARRKELVDTVIGMQYSSVLDGATTQICRHLDGKIFRINDPRLDSLRPPNHFNCRSLLVPITVADEIDQSEFVSETEIGEALDEAADGFV